MNVTQRFIEGPDSRLAVETVGDEHASTDPSKVVVMAHSILSSSMMWRPQAFLLAEHGWRVVLVDTRGHGASAAPAAPYAMSDLVADTVAVLDALGIARAHYVGLSLGGMSGFGLAIAHADRLASLMLCDARADAPPAVAAPWDERIAIARAEGCAPLAAPTLERWFGNAFLEANPETARRFHEVAAGTSVEGFVGCARAIQGLDFLDGVPRISTRTTLVVGANDGVLPQVMTGLQSAMPDAKLVTIAGAGHLPNVDQPAAFNAALLSHLARS